MENRPEIFRRTEEVEKILHPHEYLAVSKRGAPKNGEPERVKGGPEEENKNDPHLGSDQKIGKPAIMENASFRHGGLITWNTGIMERWKDGKELLRNRGYPGSSIPSSHFFSSNL
jgi:hypothetical protein